MLIVDGACGLFANKEQNPLLRFCRPSPGVVRPKVPVKFVSTNFRTTSVLQIKYNRPQSLISYRVYAVTKDRLGCPETQIFRKICDQSHRIKANVSSITIDMCFADGSSRRKLFKTPRPMFRTSYLGIVKQVIVVNRKSLFFARP
jgi:hypothetical protein